MNDRSQVAKTSIAWSYAWFFRFLASSVLALAAAMLLAAMLMPSKAFAQSDPPPSPSSLIVKLASGLTIDQQAAVIAQNGGAEISTVAALRLHVIEVAADQVDQTMANYSADPRVVRVELNKVRQSSALPSDPLYSQQWALPRIGWDLVFGNSISSGSVTVAVLDTGIDATHVDLFGNVIPGTSILDASNGLSDPSGHGTMVAGTIAARTNTSPGEGIAGIAYAGVRLMPVTVLDADGLGQDSDIIAGVIWATEHGANVIVMAFSNPGFSDSLQEAIDYAWSNNVILVAAAGNDALGTPTYPAGDRGVIGVSATDENDQLASFSNYGPSVFLAAPGTNILTTDSNNTYLAISGTSSSAAIVAGAAAQLLAIDPTLTNGVVVGRLARTADPAGTQDQTGNGRINLARALLDTGTEFIQPIGAAPIGNGGPFVGPYIAAAVNISVSLTSSVNPSTYGVAVTFTGRVTCADTKSGSACTVVGIPVTVGTLRIGEGSNCQGGFTEFASGTPNANGQLIVTKGDLSAGTHAIRACYSGTGGSNGTGDGPPTTLTQTVNAANTSTTITNAPALAVPSVVGQSYTVTYSVTVNSPSTGTPTGNVTVSDGTSACAGTVAAGQCSLTSSSAGMKTITATYAGDGNFKTSTSTGVPHTVNQASTTTTITNAVALGTSTVVGQAYTVAYNVALNSPGSGTLTGNVTVSDGTSSCTATAVANQCSLTSTSAGTKTITATYVGTSNFASSASAGVAHTVNPNTFAITTSVIGSGSISPSGSIIVTSGGNQSFTIAPSTGYHVTDVVVDGGSAGPQTTYTFTNVTANHAISANFVINTYTLSYAPGAGGSISGISPQPVTYGASGSAVTAVPDTGYHFVQWSDGVTTASRTDANVQSSLSVTATYAINTYTIIASAGPNGSIAPPGSTTFNNGSTATFTISPASGYAIADVLVDGSSVGKVPSYTFTSIAADHTIAANFADTLPPDTTISAGPASPTKNNTAVFSFSGSDNATSPASLAFECSLDSDDAFGACTSPVAYASLSEGPHTFYVRAKDGAGNVDPTPAAFSWTIDLTAPSVAIDSMPQNVTKQITATFAFHASEATSVLECSLDGAPSTLCNSPFTYNLLGEGPHTFSVRAKDEAGNQGDPITFAWNIDTTAPDETIDTTPETITNSNTATFTFHANENASFACQLDEAAAGVCASPLSYSGLGAGVHTFTVTATDAAGNVSAPATFQWLIDVEAPDTEITAGPAEASTTTDRSGTFEFTGVDNVTKSDKLLFECSLDGAEFGSCTSPLPYSDLSRTVHAFAVRAKDLATNTDATPAVRTWTITKISQTIQVTQSAPASATYNTSFSISATGGASGTPVAITASGVCSGGGDSTATITMSSGTGTCTIKFNQAGNDDYEDATQVVQTTTAQKANQEALTLTGVPSAAPYRSTFTVTPGGGSSSNALVVTTSGVCSIAGNVVTMSSGTGTCLLKVDRSGDANYNAGTQVSASATATKINQAPLSVSSPTSVTFGATGIAAASGGSSSSALSFSTGASTGCSVTGTTVTVIDASGTCSLTATRYGDNNYNSVTSPSTTVSLVKANSVTTVYAANAFYDGATHDASAVATGVGGLNQPLTVTYSGAGATTYGPSTTPPHDAGAYQAAASFGGDNNRQGSSKSVMFSIVGVVITGPTGPIAKGTAASLTVSFADTGMLTSPTCKVDNWDDQTNDVVAVQATSSAGKWTCVFTRTYSAAGVYSPHVVVSADLNNTGTPSSTSSVYQFIVVYDAGAGFVTGGGWIISPAGAYRTPDGASTNLSGKANFGFVSKYQKGANVPSGDTEFQFQTAKFDFKSTVYEWLVISGAKAQYKGSGTVNGSGNYGFLLTATDGDLKGNGSVDKFRIKVWDKSSGLTVYDNAPGSDDIDTSGQTELGGGSIVIHK